MSEPRFESIARELRQRAPGSPEGLRELVRALPQPPARMTLRLRPALAVAVAIAVAVGVGAALIGGATRPSATKERALAPRAPAPMLRNAPGKKMSSAYRVYSNVGGNSRLAIPKPTLLQPGVATSKFATPLSPTSRLQDYRAVMSLRVHDLSWAT